jgi:hypothetical protein
MSDIGLIIIGILIGITVAVVVFSIVSYIEGDR